MKQSSWLTSDSFLKRSFAIWGHSLVAQLIVTACIAVISFVIAVAFGVTSALRSPETGSGITIQVE